MFIILVVTVHIVLKILLFVTRECTRIYTPFIILRTISVVGPSGRFSHRFTNRLLMKSKELKRCMQFNIRRKMTM